MYDTLVCCSFKIGAVINNVNRFLPIFWNVIKIYCAIFINCSKNLPILLLKNNLFVTSFYTKLLIQIIVPMCGIPDKKNKYIAHISGKFHKCFQKLLSYVWI